MNMSTKDIIETINILSQDTLLTYDLFIKFLIDYNNMMLLGINKPKILNHQGNVIIRRIQITSNEVKKITKQYIVHRKEIKDHYKKDILGPFPTSVKNIPYEGKEIIDKISILLL